MPKFKTTYQNFGLGEVSNEFAARGDLNTAQIGLSKLINMDILPSGGIKRRPGLRKIANVNPNAIIIPFKRNVGEEYILILSNQSLAIYKDDALITNLVAPYTTDEIHKIQWIQRNDKMIFVQENHIPQILSLNDLWEISDFEFEKRNGAPLMPYDKFEGRNNPFTISNINKGATSTTATITSTKPNWTNEHIGTHIKFNNYIWEITSVISSTKINIETYDNTNISEMLISDWSEEIFNVIHGYPKTIAFFQNRLVFAGTNSMPMGVWLSTTDNHFNFETFSGLDTDPIYLTLMSGNRQTINIINSNENLEVLTDCGEWSIKGNPITPTNILIREHSNIGSIINVFLPLQTIDEHTIFVAKNGKEIRELTLDNLSDTYSTTNLVSLSSHLMNNPVSISYSNATKQLFVVQPNGSISVLNKNSQMEIFAWARYETDGEFKYIASTNNATYAIIYNAGASGLYKFDNEFDSDNEYEFEHRASAMPIFSNATPCENIKIIRAIARLQNTSHIKIALNGNQAENIDLHSENFNGDITVNALGSAFTPNTHAFEIIGNTGNLTLLSITIEGRIK
jgi:hypothetical protein